MRDSSPYAGQTVKLRADAAEIGGLDCAVVDWYERTSGGKTWHEAVGTDPRASSYAVRRGLGGLPDDDDVLFGRVDGMGRIVHVTEIQGYVAPTPDPTAPRLVDDRAIGLPCPACQVLLAAGDMVAVLQLGPGADPAARAAARVGQPYEAVFTELHWACRTGDESYSPTEG